MFVLGSTGALTLIVMVVLRLAVPLLGIWLLGQGLKRALPAMP